MHPANELVQGSPVSVCDLVLFDNCFSLRLTWRWVCCDYHSICSPPSTTSVASRPRASIVLWQGLYFIVIAFFFLLHMGKYTILYSSQCMVPLQKQDFKLWHGDRVLSHDAPPEGGASACRCHYYVSETQENGHCIVVLHHYHTDD